MQDCPFGPFVGSPFAAAFEEDPSVTGDVVVRIVEDYGVARAATVVGEALATSDFADTHRTKASGDEQVQ